MAWILVAVVSPPVAKRYGLGLARRYKFALWRRILA